MKVVFLSLWILMEAVPALANAVGIPNGGVGHSRGIGNQFHAAPAPLIGAGIPVALAVGGVLLGRKTFEAKALTLSAVPAQIRGVSSSRACELTAEL